MDQKMEEKIFCDLDSPQSLVLIRKQICFVIILQIVCKLTKNINLCYCSTELNWL